MMKEDQRTREPELVFGETAPAAVDSQDRELFEALRTIQEAIWRHPLAVQAAFAALQREGRRFAETPEGAELLESVARSTAFHRVRMVWDVMSLSAFDAPGDGALPSVFVERIVQQLKVRAIEPLLSRLFEQGMRR